jgi:C_GCAxxG_C_C family probable redox protein
MISIAQNKFSEGFNCAQASFYPFAIKSGMDPEQALKLTTGFGAGMVFRGEMCGAITGSMMAIGLVHGRSQADDYDSKDKTYMLIKEMHKQFTEKHGSIICKDLLKLENNESESWEKAKDLFKTHCPVFVRDAVSITEEIVNKYANERIC